MYKTFFKTTMLTLWQNKTFSILNILGLAIGIACATLIFLWVENEVNYDNFNEKKNVIYLAKVNASLDAGAFTHSSTPGVMAPAMQKEIPGIINTCRTSEGQTSLLFTIGNKSVYAAGKYAEPSMFSMFTLPFIEGNASSVFNELYSIVITEKAARKFFGTDRNVVGKTVRIDYKQEYTVTGVLKDIPENSSLQFEWLAPFQIWYQQNPGAHEWGNFCVSTYVELQPNVDPVYVNKQLNSYIQQKDPNSINHVFLFGMIDWHLRNEFQNGKQTGGGRIEYVRLFSLIAWIILLIACINFMNLSTARSERRTKEVGVRKVLGSGRSNLITQFIGEALFMAMLASVAAIIIVSAVLPVFNTLVQKNLSLGLTTPYHIGALLVITLICGLVAGSYPSFYLSSFNPLFVLKGLKTKANSAVFIRKGLVVLQFSVSVILIIATVFVYKQIQHVKSRNLGFDKNNLIEIDMQGDIRKHFTVVKNDLLNTGIVENVALSDYSTIYGGNNTSGFTWPGKLAGAKILISTRFVGQDFFSTLGMKILEGRDFQPTDTSFNKKINVIITESFEKLMGKESAMGKNIRHGDNSVSATVVGVVNDYVYGNMYGKPDPVIFFCTAPEHAEMMYVRIKAQNNAENALAKIESVMKKNNPSYPFNYRFVDEQFNSMFQNEVLIGKLSRLFAALAIIISCLGLFGLAEYLARSKTKEIGIRKVNGARTIKIIKLLNLDFIKWVAIAFFIACPIAWYAMHQWLQNFAYKTELSWWVFALAGILALAVALLTVSWQSWRAATRNPVESLRYE